MVNSLVCCFNYCFVNNNVLLTIPKLVRIKFTDNGEIVIRLAIKNNEDTTVPDEGDNHSPLFVEVSDTGVG